MELVKSPPPAGKGGKPRVDWDAVVERLRSNPGVWGVLEDVSRSTATHIKMGRIKAFDPPEWFEAETRKDPKVGKARGTLYVRYLGS